MDQADETEFRMRTKRAREDAGTGRKHAAECVEGGFATLTGRKGRTAGETDALGLRSAPAHFPTLRSIMFEVE